MKFNIILSGLLLSIFLFVGQVEAGAPILQVEAFCMENPLSVSTGYKITTPGHEAYIPGGNNITIYEIRVTNQGTAPDRNITVRCEFPKELKILNAMGVHATIQGQKATFQPYPVLEPRQVISFKIRAKAVKSGDARVKFYVNSESLRGREYLKECRTQIFNASMVLAPILQVEAFCMENPLFVSHGENTTVYEIRVTNQGTAPDRNITVRCEFPKELKILNAMGVHATIQGQKATFQPYPVLKQRQVISFKIRAKAVKPGDARVKFYVNSESLRGREYLEEVPTIIWNNTKVSPFFK